MKGIQISLTNGSKSPVFQTPDGERLQMMTVESEDITYRIRKVSSYISNDDKYIYGIKLCGEDGKILFN